MAGFEGTQRYHIIKQLGQGGMGAVYEVEDVERERRCALKVMQKAGTRALMRFKREFRAVAQLRHPHLVQLYDLHAEGEHWFYTMELIDGASVLEVLTGKTETARSERLKTLQVDAIDLFVRSDGSVDKTVPLPTMASRSPAACDVLALRPVLAQLLDALEFLHDRDIVHRDLKPDNILIDVHGQVRVMDFGIVKHTDDDNQATGEKGDVVGTMAYMAPEQASAPETIGPAADLYSLGCVLYQLLCGSVPFEGHPFQVLMAHQTEQPAPLPLRVEGVPEAFMEVCHALLSKSPAARPGIESIREQLDLPRSEAQQRTRVPAEIFVGRKEELALLQSHIEAVEGGEPSHAVTISGESGAGKTCLTGAAIDRAKKQGFEVIRGRCYEREALPFRAFDQIMDGVAIRLSTEPAEVVAALRPSLAVASRIFPALSLVAERAGLAGTLAPGQAQLRGAELRAAAFEAIVRLIDHLGQKAPLLLSIDDLQWTDTESMALLRALLDAELGRVLIFGMFRPEGVVGEHPLRVLIDARRRVGDLTTIALEPLSTEEITALVREVIGEGALTGPQTQPIVEQTGGNPFFAVQLALVLRRKDVQLRISETMTLPSISELVALRFSELSQDARQVMELAATAGGASTSEVLRRASGLDPERFDVALESLLAERIVRPALEDEDDASGGTYDLYHDKFRELAYASLAPDVRTAMHRALAEALEATADPGHAEALLRHWRAVGDGERGLRYALVAAEQAEAKLAFARAAELLRTALEMEPGAAWDVRAQRWERIGSLMEIGGDEIAAIESWRNATDLIQDRIQSTPRGPARTELQLLLGRLRRLMAAALFRIRELDESQKLYQQILAPMGLRLRRSYTGSLMSLGLLQTLLLGWLALPDTLFRRKVTARDRETVQLYNNITDSVGWMWLTSGLEYNVRASLLSRRLDDDTLRLKARVIRAGTVGFAGNTSPMMLGWAHRAFDRAEAWSKRHQIPLGVEFTQRWRGSVHMQHSAKLAYEGLGPCVEGYERQGALHSDEGVWAMGWLILACEALSKDAEAERMCTSMAKRQTAWAKAFANAPLIRILARRGDFERGDAMLATWSPTLTKEPTAEHFWLVLSQGLLDATRGDYRAIIERHHKLYPAAHEMGQFILNFNTSFWLAPYLEAINGLARDRQLSPAELTRGHRLAARMRTRGTVGHRPLGARTEALLAHFGGRAGKARSHIGRALRLSEVCETPYHRWLCLEAARELGAASDGHLREAGELADAHGFVLPP